MTKQNHEFMLIKFGKKCDMEEFRKGVLYMNTLKYFEVLEEKCELRSDKDEGLTAVYQAKGASLSRQNSQGKYVHIGTITNQLQYREKYSVNENIFCMYALQVQTKMQNIDKRNLKFGNTLVLILDPVEFLNRVKLAAEKEGIRVFHKLVEYVDREKHSGSVGPFRKFSEFSYQNEFRILVCQESPRRYKLSIGNISDITEQGELSSENLNSLTSRMRLSI
jgi:hypothetical protein